MITEVRGMHILCCQMCCEPLQRRGFQVHSIVLQQAVPLQMCVLRAKAFC